MSMKYIHFYPSKSVQNMNSFSSITILWTIIWLSYNTSNDQVCRFKLLITETAIHTPFRIQGIALIFMNKKFMPQCIYFGNI